MIPRDAVKTLYTDLLKERNRWAKSTHETAVAKTVAYQNAASMVLRVLDEYPDGAQYLHAPHDQLRVSK